MLQNQIYISVLYPPNAEDSITLNFRTFDADSNIDLSVDIDLDTEEDENATAQTILEGINTFLIANNIKYNDTPNGAPVFSNEQPRPTFRCDRTDHIISIWCQARYEVRLTDNSADVQLRIEPHPTFLTIEEAPNFAVINGVEFKDINENELTREQLGMLLSSASDQVTKLINNKIVRSTYLQSVVGSRTGSIQLKVRPVVGYDLPQVRRPYIIGITSILITKSPVAYQCDPETGILNYRFNNDLIEISEPFDMNNEIKVTYIGGYQFVPTMIKSATIYMATQMLEDQNVKSLKGGSMAVEFRPPAESLRYMLNLLREYRLFD